MKRESFKSRLGFLLVSAGVCDRNWKCLAFSVCDGTKWRRNFRTVLLDLSGDNGIASSDNGAGSWSCQQKECGAWL